jgi:hypothetical protein
MAGLFLVRRFSHRNPETPAPVACLSQLSGLLLSGLPSTHLESAQRGETGPRVNSQKRRALSPVENFGGRVPAAHKRALDCYAVSLQLRCKVTSKRGPVQGFAQTRMMSSKEIVFAPADGLEPGMMAEMVLDWPPGLDDHRLQLVLQVTVGTQDGEAEARISSYQFRTAGSTQTAQSAESAGAA